MRQSVSEVHQENQKYGRSLTEQDGLLLDDLYGDGERPIWEEENRRKIRTRVSSRKTESIMGAKTTIVDKVW